MFFQHWSFWPEHQRLALPLWIRTYDQYRAGEKNDTMLSIIRTLVEPQEVDKVEKVIIYNLFGFLSVSVSQLVQFLSCKL